MRPREQRRTMGQRIVWRRMNERTPPEKRTVENETTILARNETMRISNETMRIPNETMRIPNETTKIAERNETIWNTTWKKRSTKTSKRKTSETPILSAHSAHSY
jgi:hypothetical protein